MEGADLSARHDNGHIDIPRLASGSVGLQAFAAYVPASTAPEQGFAVASSKIKAIRGFCDANPDALRLVTTAGEAWSAVRDGGTSKGDAVQNGGDAPLPDVPARTGILLTVENGIAIQDDIANLERLRTLGVRSMTLVHSEHLPWVASCTGTGDHDGLTSFGRGVVAEMVRLGMLVDVSHSSEAAFWRIHEAIEPLGAPLVATHSNSSVICNHPRNLTNDLAKAIAATGGVIGVNYYPTFLDQAYYDTREATLAAGIAEASLPGEMADHSVPLRRVVEHIEHFAELLGWDHVALGSDFDGIPVTPTGLDGSDDVPALLDDLRGRGHSESDLEKLAWRNALRVLEAAG